MTKKLEVLYDEIRQSFGFDKDDNDGWLLPKFKKENEPLIFLNSKQIITPTRTVLKKPNWDKYQPFHPLCEKTNRNKSDILIFIQRAVNDRIATVLSSLIIEAADLAMDSSVHSSLSVKMLEIVKLFNGAKEKTPFNIANLLSYLLESKDDFITVGLVRNGEVYGNKFNRVATITFPVFEEEYKESGKVYKHTIAGRDKEIFYRVMHGVLPNIDENNCYMFGSNGYIAPQFQALMSAFAKVAIDLNNVTSLFAEVNPEFYANNYIPLDWVDELDDLKPFKDEIGTLPGCAGELNIADVDKELARHAKRESKSSKVDKSLAPIDYSKDVKRKTPVKRKPVIEEDDRDYDDDRDDRYERRRDDRDDRERDRDRGRRSYERDDYRRDDRRESRRRDDRDDYRRDNERPSRKTNHYKGAPYNGPYSNDRDSRDSRDNRSSRDNRDNRRYDRDNRRSYDDDRRGYNDDRRGDTRRSYNDDRRGYGSRRR